MKFKFTKVLEDVLNPAVDRTEKEVIEIKQDELFLILVAIKQVWKTFGVEAKKSEKVKKIDDAIKIILDGDSLVKNAGLFGISPDLNDSISDKKNRTNVEKYLKEPSIAEKWFEPCVSKTSTGVAKDLLDK